MLHLCYKHNVYVALVLLFSNYCYLINLSDLKSNFIGQYLKYIIIYKITLNYLNNMYYEKSKKK